MPTATTIVALVEYYLAAGLVVAVAFLVFGIERVEPGSRGSYAFRPLLVPGICLLWPLVVVRWWSLERGRK